MGLRCRCTPGGNAGLPLTRGLRGDLGAAPLSQGLAACGALLSQGLHVSPAAGVTARQPCRPRAPRTHQRASLPGGVGTSAPRVARVGAGPGAPGGPPGKHRPAPFWAQPGTTPLAHPPPREARPDHRLLPCTPRSPVGLHQMRRVVLGSQADLFPRGPCAESPILPDPCGARSWGLDSPTALVSTSFTRVRPTGTIRSRVSQSPAPQPFLCPGGRTRPSRALCSRWHSPAMAAGPGPSLGVEMF